MSAAVRVGFVGIGHMGRPMARNLLRGGYVLHVFDADFAKAARFAGELGGSAAPDLAGLGRDSDLVVTMLPTGGDVRDVLMGGVGADAVLAGGAGAALAASLAPGAVVVDMSSSDPLGTRELGARLKDKGIALIDAPVSGLVTRAESGTLTIMIGA
ncbi:MAG TPA: NAD(P)-binding domain-containing protein, partial [Gammaproteobacteria bacterium]|nr:NAD(P)-binding domain-containing protein [Gammaproteobacteria bacterium]